MGIPSAGQYKVVQVHRVNGSSELIYAGWQAALRVSRYAQQKQYRTRRGGYKVKTKRDSRQVHFAEGVLHLYRKHENRINADLVSRLRKKKKKKNNN